MQKRKKRLCFLLPSHYSGIFGGAQYQAKVLLEELVKRDEYEIYYLARNIDPDYKPEGYTILKIPSNRYLKRLGFFVDCPILLRMLKKISPDVIYQRGFTSYTGYAAYYAKRHEARLVFHIASDFDVIPYGELKKQHSFSVPFIEKKIGEFGLRQADSLITQTRVQSDLLKSNYGRDVTAIVKNFHPMPDEIVEKKDTIKIIWVANFKRVKRPELFVRLAKDLQHLENVEFLMIGRAGDESLYGNLHQEIGEMNNLMFVGEQSQADVNRIIASAHILVNTSLLEGFPNTFIQAWMRKVPVVTAGVNSDGLFNDGSIGFCGNTYEKMKGYIMQLIQNESLRVDIGECAQNYAFKEHTITNADKLISVIRGSD